MDNEFNSEGRQKVDYEVKWRGGFADREGIRPINVEIQKDDLDDRIRKKLYFLFREIMNGLKNEVDSASYSGGHKFTKLNTDYNFLINSFFRDFYIVNLEAEKHYARIGYGKTYLPKMVEDTINNDVMGSVFSFVEFFTSKLKIISPGLGGYFEDETNKLFEEEYVNYRVIASIVSPITNEVEIETVKTALESPYAEVNDHMAKALKKLSDRDNIDYGNSIKESISSVETMSKIITGENNTTLGQALKSMEDSGVYIHPALKKAFGNLYGYTSDAKGIRHGQITGEDATFAEAQFMLVACSAFNNYLLANISK